MKNKRHKKIKKFIVIFSIAMIVSLSIPHIMLWNFSAGTAAGRAETGCALSPTVAGRTVTTHWTNSNWKRNPPGRCTDEYTGDVSNASIGARINSRLIQAGGAITVTGSVSKICNKCNGWIYTCQAFQELACKVDDKTFSLDYTYKDCPSDLPDNLYEEGKDNFPKWDKILQVVGTIAEIASLFGGGGSTPTTTPTTTTPTPATPASSSGSSSGLFGMSSSIWRWIGIGAFAGSMIVEKAPTDHICYRICGINYNTDAGRAPKCDEGLGTAEVPILYNNATYSCTAGYCGMWENKRIKIEVFDPSNNIVKSDYTTTDAYGQFSYTFMAPPADGEFIAIVSVPLQ